MIKRRFWKLKKSDQQAIAEFDDLKKKIWNHAISENTINPSFIPTPSEAVLKWIILSFLLHLGNILGNSYRYFPGFPTSLAA